ncbi:hypothetical protein BDQ17DRAFT_1392929 [Cyathus striatus]|nr:hypothetical protein BDQ17DRAFT_1392929 [Cyathus striatus]
MATCATVIACIPTPLSGPPHLVTATSDMSVGAEYIIMDVADGIELHVVWHQLTMKQKLQLVNQWIKFKSKVIKAFSSSGYGSLYYHKDIPAQMTCDFFVDALKNDEFVLGPSTLQIGYWEDIYSNPTDIDLDCGLYFITPWEPHSHLKVPQEHIHLLNMYDNVTNFTLHDSNQGNIFLSHEAFERDGTVEISAVIDWQNTAEEALLKEKAYLHKAYHVLYLETDLDIVWASALSFDGKYTMAQQLPSAAQFCWHGGYPKLKQLLIRTMVEWEAIAGPGVTCPITPGSFSEQDMAQVHEDEHAWQNVNDYRTAMELYLGVESGGWVFPDDYDRTVKDNDDLLKEWIASIENDDLGGVDPADIWLF